MKDSIRRVYYCKKTPLQAQIVYAHRSKEPCKIYGGVKTGFDSGGISIDKVVSEIMCCAYVCSPTKLYSRLGK